MRNAGHVVIGGGLAVVGLRAVRPQVPGRLAGPVAVFVLVCAFLGAAEGLQAVVGRSASWLDLGRGAAGAVAALAGAAAVRSSGLVRLALASGAAVAVAVVSIGPARVLVDVVRQRAEFPLLGSFEREVEVGRWAFGSASASRVRDPVTHGEWSLRVVLHPVEPYPGVALPEAPPDWRGHRDLVMDVRLEGDRPLRLTLGVTDEENDGTYADQFHRRVPLVPGPNEVRVPLAAVERTPSGRRLDLSRVRRLALFAERLDGERTFVLDHVRLE